jgi:Family of unknown function (DUF5681)
MPKKLWEKGKSANPAGRPKGAKDKIPRGTLKAVYQELLEAYNGHELMLGQALKALKNRKATTLALGHMELASKVLDRVGDVAPTVNINLNSNVNPAALKNLKPKQTEEPPQ